MTELDAARMSASERKICTRRKAKCAEQLVDDRYDDSVMSNPSLLAFGVHGADDKYRSTIGRGDANAVPICWNPKAES
jgi:hypothetical protein